MQTIEEYNRSKKNIEQLKAEIKSLTQELEDAKPEIQRLASKRDEATAFMPHSDYEKIRIYKEIERTIAEQKRQFEELRKKEQQEVYDAQTKLLEAYKKGDKSTITSEEQYKNLTQSHEEIAKAISEDRLALQDGGYYGQYGHEALKLLQYIKRNEEALKSGREDYGSLKGKEKTAKSMFTDEEAAELEAYRQKLDMLRKKEAALKAAQKAQRNQDREDIGEFFGIQGPLEHTGNGMKMIHDDKTGIDTPILDIQSTSQLRMTSAKLRRILDDKFDSGEIDEATYDMLYEKVSLEYKRMIGERQGQAHHGSGHGGDKPSDRDEQ